MDRPVTAAASLATFKARALTAGVGGAGGVKTRPSYAARVGRGASPSATAVDWWAKGVCPYTVTWASTARVAMERRTLERANISIE